MAKRSAQPALYEMMRGRDPASTVERPDSDQDTDLPVGPTSMIEFKSGNWLAPGRLIRLPVGYVLLAAGLCMALLFIVYTVGVSRGKAAAKQDADTQFLNSPAAIVNDPLVSLAPVDSAGKPQSSPGSATTQASPKARPTNPAGWGPVVPAQDPRKRGLNYLVLMQTNHEGALRFATFCRENGLETYVVRGKNDRIRKVIAFPGFPSSALVSKEVTDLRSFIQSIGLKWNEKERRKDWSESLAELYDG